MRTFENYLLFIVCALGTILNVCNGYSLQDFYNHMLQEHNKYRTLHEVGSLFLDEDLCTDARNYIKLIRPGKSGYQEEYSERFNESSFYIYESADTSQWDDETIVNNIMTPWYNENVNYNYSVESEFKTAEHFTQMVWKDTRSFGVAITQDRDGILVVVCYKPPGNVTKQYATNVKPPNWSIFQ